MRSKEDIEYLKREILNANEKLIEAKLSNNEPAMKCYKFWLSWLIDEDLNERKKK